jgi:hypothetical protein
LFFFYRKTFFTVRVLLSVTRTLKNSPLRSEFFIYAQNASSFAQNGRVPLKMPHVRSNLKKVIHKCRFRFMNHLLIYIFTLLNRNTYHFHTKSQRIFTVVHVNTAYYRLKRKKIDAIWQNPIMNFLVLI